jgi:adenylate cyclase
MADYVTTRKLVAILCADVAGYSRLMGDDDHETVQTLSAYRKVFTAQIAEHGGRLIDTAGDSILAEFPSVVAGVQCAIAVQTTLREHNAGLPEHRKMWFRIGINAGDVLAKDDGTIYGDSVNIAARLEALADPGSICISGSVHDSVHTRLELVYTDLGEQSVKNIRQPVRAYRVILDHDAAARPKPAPLPKHKGHQTKLIAVAVLLILAIAGVLSWQMFWHSTSPPVNVASKQLPPLTLPDNPSIAVLPFENMSGDSQQEYFSDGITDTLITDLSQLRNLVVIARNSTFTYKGKAVDVRQVGQELGVRYVLEGSVQRASGRVRINAQLVDTSTGKHLWATRFDRPLNDIFTVQDEITREIVAALDVELTEGEQTRVWRRTTDSPKAYDYFLQGHKQALQFTKQDTARARELFMQALALDPKFAAAMAYLGWTYLLDADLWGISPKESWEKMRMAAQKALALDDSLGEAYSVLSFYYYRHVGDAEQAIANIERAITLSPGSAHHHHIASLIYTNIGGQPARGLTLIQRAIRLNPFPPALYFGALGEAYFGLGRYGEAIDANQKTLRLLPDFLPAYVNLTATYSAIGREAEARAHAQEVLRINPNFSVNTFTAHFHAEMKGPYRTLLLQAGLPE